jgi:hypothetical protein
LVSVPSQVLDGREPARFDDVDLGPFAFHPVLDLDMAVTDVSERPVGIRPTQVPLE